MHSHFVSALTVVFVNSKSLSSIKIDDTPVDDPSLKVLVANNSDTLKLLKMSSCPHVSPAVAFLELKKVQSKAGLSNSFSLAGLIRYSGVAVAVSIVMYFFLCEEEFDPFFREETPVTHLYFGRAVSKEMLGRIGLNCPRLVELVVCANGLQPLDDELIRIADRCQNLTAIGLGECEVTCSGFVEFVKRCGGRLSQLSIMEEVLIPDSKYSVEQIHYEVSKHLGRMWFPDMMPTW
ncbi:UNVERIFIED_CONTAM: hypothetical protein FKN15_018736 [Acipenser sinensis]